MSLVRTLILAAASLLLLVSAFAQDPVKHFAKDGFSFDSNGWTIVDESNADAQQLTLGRVDSEAMIKFFVHRGRVNSPEKMAQAKSKLIDPYVEFTAKQFLQMGAKPERIPASTEIGGLPAEGVRIKAVLGSESGEAVIYWNTVGDRLVVDFFRPGQGSPESNTNLGHRPEQREGRTSTDTKVDAATIAGKEAVANKIIGAEK